MRPSVYCWKRLCPIIQGCMNCSVSQFSYRICMRFLQQVKETGPVVKHRVIIKISTSSIRWVDRELHLSSVVISVSVLSVSWFWRRHQNPAVLRAHIFHTTERKQLKERDIVDEMFDVTRFDFLEKADFCSCTCELTSCTVCLFRLLLHHELMWAVCASYNCLHVDPVLHVFLSVKSPSHCFLPVYCQGSVSKLGSSCCPPTLCLAWLSAEQLATVTSCPTMSWPTYGQVWLRLLQPNSLAQKHPGCYLLF